MGVDPRELERAGLVQGPDGYFITRQIAERARQFLNAKLDPEVEAKGEIHGLHDFIMKWCLEHRVPCGHADPSGRSHYTEGWPDFSLVWWNSLTVWGECKQAGGKLTAEQQQFKLLVEARGHLYCIWRTRQGFLDTINSLPDPKPE